jgi:tRNA A-37 threonylcarbamoyl transferase component Bud32
MQSDARPISDRWELTERIGSGAMGEVWRGRHRVLGHAVAVKVMKRDASRDQSMVARFLREARIAAKLRHRNVARVEDFGTTPEAKPFLVMELLQGTSLEDLIERGERPTRARALTVARHVGAACDVAHAEGVVHRDLKPANCFLVVDEDGADLVKVLDFGVAKVSDGLLATQHAPGGFSLIGTPVYMSPEQARGDEVLDGRSDLWSLGVMLYELLTGALPFQGDSLPMLLLAIQSHDPTPPSAHDPTLPPSVDAWTARALARDPARRFRNGREMADALAIALAGAMDPRSSTQPAYAPTAEFARHPAPLAPNTLAPTQPMRAVAPSYAPLGPVSLPPGLRTEPTPAHAPPRRDLRPLWAVSALLLVGAAIFAAALLRHSEPEVTVAAPRAPEAPVRPIPVTAVNAAPHPAAEPTPSPNAPAVRPAPAAPTIAAPAPRPAPTLRAPRVAREAPIAPSPLVLPQAPPAAPSPTPMPTGGAYNPEQP